MWNFHDAFIEFSHKACKKCTCCTFIDPPQTIGVVDPTPVHALGVVHITDRVIDHYVYVSVDESFVVSAGYPQKILAFDRVKIRIIGTTMGKYPKRK